jgi:methionyl-tRNA formyltransferase
MEITIFFTYKDHPIYPYLIEWKNQKSHLHKINLTNNITEIKNGDILFLIACSEIVKNKILSNFKKTLCVHESDLPKGRGWSPAVYSILNNEKKIFLTLFEAGEKVDSGDIWKKIFFSVGGHELHDEINQKISLNTIEMIDFSIENFDTIQPIPQRTEGVTYLERRIPKDSKLDINKSIAEQFNLMRIADPNRYPCFFDYRNNRYKINITKDLV